MQLPGLTATQMTELLFSVGHSPKDVRPLSPVEVGEYCSKAIEAGATHEEVLTACDMTDGSMIGKFLKVKELRPSIRHLVNWGSAGKDAIGFSTAHQLSRMETEHQEFAAQALLKYQLSRNEMRSVIQLLDRPGQALEDCIERVAKRRSVVIVKNLIIGALISDELKDRLGGMLQLARDELFLNVLAGLYPETEKYTARLGVERFTIIGGKSVAGAMADDDSMEQRVTDRLLEETGTPAAGDV